MSLPNNKTIGGTSLGGTSLGGTSLGGTSLGGTSLGGSSLSNTSLGGTSLGGNSLSNTSLSNTPLTQSKNTQPIKNNNTTLQKTSISKTPLPKKTEPKPKTTESLIAAKIRKLQEEKLLKEKEREEEEIRLKKKEEERRLKEIEKEKQQHAIKEKLKYQQQLQLEKNKGELEQKEKEMKMQAAIAKYGYTPDAITKKHNTPKTPKNKLINKPEIIPEKVVVQEEKIIISNPNSNINTDVKEDWDASSDENISVQVENSVPIKTPSLIISELTEQNELESLRAPIVCVLGHVDAGKTHLLDKIRSSLVNQTEAGQITQQIGASYVPIDIIVKHTQHVDSQFKNKLNYEVPGLIFIDTPGHEPFLNLRSRASSLCDMAILVVDILVGIQKQTLECIKLLISSKKLFVIALNKVDLLYGWKSAKNISIRSSLKNQEKHVLAEFDSRVRHIWTQFQELGHNTELYYKNKNFVDIISMVPISAITGEGISDLLMLLAQLSQKYMHSNLIKNNIVDCTVLEVKNVQGRGMTIDIILTNGELCRGDKIILCGIKGEPIITYIKTILTHSYSTRKGEYIQTNKVRASMTCKIDAPNLDGAISGSPVYVIKPNDSDECIEIYKKNVMHSLNLLKSKINNSGEGVYVNASSLGSMEALFEYLNSDDCNVSIGGFRIGAVHKKDVTKAAAVGEKTYACILAFDVEITDDIKEYAKSVGVKIFEDEIIYKLFDTFSEYIKNVREVERNKISEKAVFPCICRILPACIFNKHAPIIIGVHIEDGILKKGTPICIPSKDGIEIGMIKSIEKNHKDVEEAKSGDEVCISIVQKEDKQQYSYGRHFESDDKLYSKISRESIDALKELYPEIVTQRDIFKLIKRLKKEFGII